MLTVHIFMQLNIIATTASLLLILAFCITWVLSQYASGYKMVGGVFLERTAVVVKVKGLSRLYRFDSVKQQSHPAFVAQPQRFDVLQLRPDRPLYTIVQPSHKA